ncbi:MAG: hypothetical protein GF401_15725, partial [Chitinivibrionales bacterium]|nr:hypothetical protein [Chitinivibrionales bacterium]
MKSDKQHQRTYEKVRKDRSMIRHFFQLITFLQIASWAAVSPAIVYQGILTDSEGNPRTDSSYRLTFSLYDGATGGTALWSESQTVATSKGAFSVHLGDTTDLALPFDKTYWLGIALDGSAELSPRVRLGTSGYALRANVADSAETVRGGTAKVNNLFNAGLSNASVTVDATGNVGIGTTSPSRKFQVLGGNEESGGAFDNVVSVATFGDSVKPGLGKGLTLGYNKLSGRAVFHTGPYSWGGYDFLSYNGSQWINSVSFSNDGKVGIGTTNPSYRLSFGSYLNGITNGEQTVALFENPGGSNQYGISAIRRNDVWRTAIFANSAEGISVDIFGNVGIKDTTPDAALSVCGTIKASGAITTDNTLCSSSDRRLKTNIHTLTNALETIKSLRGVAYQWDRRKHPERNLPGGRQIGLIAQEVEEVLPEIVQTGSDGYKTMSYDRLVAVLIEAMKAQQRTIEEL